jgi:hypothetical protein
MGVWQSSCADQAGLATVAKLNENGGQKEATHMSTASTLPPVSSAKAVEERFHRLAAEWKEQAGYLSNTVRMAMLPAYQRIIGIGMAVVPLILEELRRQPHHWFWALEAITEQNPVPREALGKTQAMAAAWLDWGKKQGLIPA